MVPLTVYFRGRPPALTLSMVSPPPKVRLSRAKRSASYFRPSASPLAPAHASRELWVAVARLPESALKVFWSSYTHR